MTSLDYTRRSWFARLTTHSTEFHVLFHVTLFLSPIISLHPMVLFLELFRISWYLFIYFYCQKGNNSSSVGGANLNKGDSVSLGPGGTFCLVGDSYRYFIHFDSASSDRNDVPDEEPRAKKARYDALSDSDDDNLTVEDLEDMRREFGDEMVEKIQRRNKLQDRAKQAVKQEDLGCPASKDSWENIDGKLIIFTSKGMEAKSKVSLMRMALVNNKFYNKAEGFSMVKSLAGTLGILKNFSDLSSMAVLYKYLKR